MKLQSVLVAIGLIVAGALLGSMITPPATAQNEVDSLREPVREARESDSAIRELRVPSASEQRTEAERPAYYYYDSLRKPAPGDGFDESSFEDEQMPGRFQMALERMNNSNRIVVVVCDTSTGQCWSGQVGSSNWKSMGVPSFVKTKDFMPVQPGKGDGFMEQYEEQPSQSKQPYVPIGPSLNVPPQ